MLKKISCDPKCGFEVKSHDENELVSITMAHAKRFHSDLKVSEKDIKKMIKSA